MRLNLEELKVEKAAAYFFKLLFTTKVTIKTEKNRNEEREIEKEKKRNI